MKPRKVVVVSDFKDDKGEPLYYDIPQHLNHGFIAAGHFATRFSDRDAARSLGFGHKALGARAMKKRLRRLVSTLRPDLVLFGHADLFSAEDFQDLRRAWSGARLAQINVDSPYRRATMEKFAARTPSMDASFFTAAALGPVVDLFDPRRPIFYTPPPVSAAIETGRAFAVSAVDAPRDVAFLGSVCVDRPAQIETLRARLPASVRFEARGAVNGTPGVVGADFIDFMSETPMSPSLQPDTAVAEAPLYMSTRVAQLLGNGVLGFSHRSTELDALYEDGIRLYDDVPALAEDIARFARDDAARRRLAEIGWRLAHERASASVVCDYIVKTALGEDAAAPWPMAGDLFAQSA